TTLRAGMLLPTWSLAVEEQFYLVLPLLLRWVPKRALPATLVALIASAPVLRTAIFSSGPQGGLYYSLLPCRWDALFMGVLAAWLVRRGPINSRTTLTMLVISGGALIALHWTGPTSYSVGMATVGYTVAAATFTALILL